MKLTKLILGLISVTLSVNTWSVVIDLGDASSYNIFVKKNFELVQGDVRGKIAAGGNANISYATVGSRHNGDTVLVTGGNLYAAEWASNTVKGSAFVGGQVIGSKTNVLQNSRISTNPVDFNGTFSDLTRLSSDLSKLSSTDTLSNVYGSLRLNGSSVDGLYVQNVNYNIFNNQFHELNVSNLTSTDILVFNISGINVNMANLNLVGTHNGFTSNNVLYNFYEAETINMMSGDYVGTFLAPNADMTFNSGTLLGQTIAQSWRGSSGQIDTGNLVFPGYNIGDNGGIDPIQVPEPASWMLGLMGLAALFALRYRRLAKVAPAPAYA